MSNLYQRMTETLANNMGDALAVKEQFREAITHIADLEKELIYVKDAAGTVYQRQTIKKLEDDVERISRDNDRRIERDERVLELTARNEQLKAHCYELAQKETEALIQILEQKAAIKCLQEVVTQLRSKKQS